MNREQFKKTVDVVGGQFTFETEKYEGMIGVTPARIVIWVDDRGFSSQSVEDDESEPKNVGEFKNADDLLETFAVDGMKFELLLPEIKSLSVMMT